jgi:hypothetical protein
MKRIHCKKNNIANPQKQGERHHMLKVSIDGTPSRPIITSLNKIVNYDTNSLVPTLAPIKLFKKNFFTLGVYLINLTHMFQVAPS